MAAHRALAGRRALSRRTRPFQESVIREMTRLHAEVGGVNLAQGLPDFDPPPELVAALERAIAVPANHQYGWTWGLPALRAAVSEKTARVNGIRSDPETEVTITCGVSEARRGRGARPDGARRRGDRPGALVRELRSGLRAGGGEAPFRGALRAGLPPRPEASGSRDHAEDPPDPGQHAGQPLRPRLHARRASRDRPPLPAPRSDRRHRRDLRAPVVRRPPARRAWARCRAWRTAR